MSEDGAGSVAVPQLQEVESRVLGCMIEKGVTTPEYYPLTLNALVAACNQKSNRTPVVAYDEKTVARGLQSLRDQQLARTVSGAEQRVPKHYQVFTARFGLTPPQVAAMCVLMLRGPQTLGEIRGRSARMHEFLDLDTVQATLDQLMGRDGGALVTLLPRLPGRKEQRHAHTLAPPPEEAPDEERQGPVEPAMAAVQDENERIGRLETEVMELRTELDVLRQELTQFKSQFD